MDQHTPADPDYPFLLWAMGSCLEVPDGLAPDEGRLHSRLAFHRLTGRFYHRARAQKPPWCSQHMLFAAWKHHRKTVSYFERQLNAARQVTEAVSTPDSPVVFIKGFSAYALTGDETIIRHSNDLDVLHRDLPALYAVCQDLGYDGEITDGHEFSRMKGHGLLFELHHHAIVQRYPREAPPGSMLPANNPGWWSQPVTQRGNLDLTYECILPHAVPGRGAAEGVFVPGAEMSALIACAHEFREHLGRPWWRSKIKLAVLAEIWDLCRAPGFDAVQLADLAVRHQAQDAVLYAGHLLNACHGENPLPAPAGSSAWASTGRFPQEITPIGCWAEFETLETLVSGFNADVWMTALEPNTVFAGEDGATPWHAVEEGSAAIPRIISQSPRGRFLPFRFRVAPDAEGMAVEVAAVVPDGENVTSTLITHDDASTDYHIHMIAADAGPCEYVKEHNVFRPTPEIQDRGETWVDHIGPEWLFRLRLPWSVFSAAYREASARPFMLRVAAWTTDIEAADPVVCVPLTFVSVPA